MYECFPAHIHVHYVCAVPAGANEDGVRFSKTGVTDNSELLCGFWKPKLGPLQEQQMLLIIEQSIQPLSNKY